MTRKSLRTKRIFSIILSLAVALTMMPVSALAADGTSTVENAVAEVTAGSTTKPYTDIDAAFAAAQEADSATVKLLSDVTTTSEIEVDSGTFTIDLNGKKWEGTDTHTLLVSGGNVTVTSTDGVGTITCSSNNAIYVDSGATVHVKSGVRLNQLYAMTNANLTLDAGVIITEKFFTKTENIAPFLAGKALQRCDADGAPTADKYVSIYQNYNMDDTGCVVVIEHKSCAGTPSTENPCKICGYDGTQTKPTEPENPNLDVAEVNGTKYKTLAEAIQAANGADITLLTIVSENVVVDGGSIKAGIILGNGETIDDIPYPSNWVADRNGIPLTMKAGEITLKDGALAQFSASSSANVAIALKGGTLIVETTVTKIIGSNRSDSVQHAAIEATGGVLDLQGNTLLDGGLTMSGDAQLKNKLTAGTFTNSGSDTYSVSVEGSSQYGAVFDLLETGYAFAEYDADNEGDTTGAVIVKDDRISLTEDVSVIKCTHKGANNKSLFKDNTCTGCGLTCVHETVKNGVCTVCNTAMGAQDNTGKYYIDLAEAFEGVADGGTVTMLTTLNDDTISFCRDAEGNPVEKTVTLMMNGHSLSYEGTPSLDIQSGKLIIGDEATISQPAQAAVPAVSVDNDEQSKDRGTLEFKAKASLTGGLLIQNYGKLVGGLKEGTIITSNGTYSVSVERSDTYGNVLGLLGDGLAFAKYDESAENKAGAIVNGNVKQLTEAVIIVPCTHKNGDSSLFKDGTCIGCGLTCTTHNFVNGVCSVCGYVCPHTDVNDQTGKCNACQAAMVAKVTLGEATTYYTDVNKAITSVADGSTVTVISEERQQSISQNTTVPKNVAITLDLNGHTLDRNALKVNTEGSKLTVKDSSGGNGRIGLSVWRGTLIFNPGNKKTTISQLNVYGGNVKLYGGKIEKTNDLTLGTDIKMNNLLPDGYAYRFYVGESMQESLDYMKAAKNDLEGWKSAYNLVPELCDHTKLESNFNEANCPYCNSVLAATVTKDSKTTGYTTAQNAVNEANGGTVKLLADVSKTLTISSEFKLDCNGHTITTLTVNNNVTLESLLPEGYAFKSDGTWVSDSNLIGKAELDKVTTAEAPIKSVTAVKSNVTINYGESVTLTVNLEYPGDDKGFNFTWYCNDWYQNSNNITTMKKIYELGPLTPNSTGKKIYRLEFTKDGYSKSCEFVVTVNAKALTDAMVGTIANQTYDGNAQTPKVTVKDGKKTLVKDKDYTVVYADNTNAGEAMATIKGQGNYTGQVVKKFTIQPKDMKSTDIIVEVAAGGTYDGKAKKPDVTVKDGDKTLIADTDYTPSYENNINAGVNTAKVTVTGKGNYSGEVVKNFSIAKADYVSGNVYKVGNTYVYSDGGDTGNFSLREFLATGASYMKDQATMTKAKLGEDEKELLAGNISWSDDTNLSFKTKPCPASYKATLTIPVNGGQNYNNYEVVYTITVVEKNAADVTITGLPEDIKYGDKFTLSASQVADQYYYENSEWSWNFDTIIFEQVGETKAEVIKQDETHKKIINTITLKAIKAGDVTADIKAFYESSEYKGSSSVTVNSIEKKALSKDDFEIPKSLTKVYDRTAKHTENVEISLKDSSKVQSSDTLNFAVTKDNIRYDNASAGKATEATLTLPDISSNPNYMFADNFATIEVDASITAKPITIASATAIGRSYTKGDSDVDVDVTFNGLISGETLEKDTDYTVNGTMEDANAGDNKNVNVTVTLKNSNYSLAKNTTTTKVKIMAKAVEATVTVEKESFIYNGKAHEPKVVVKDGNTTIDEKEYTVSYANNTNAGKATVTITNEEGGNYAVSGGTNFIIARYDISTAPVQVIFEKSLTYNDKPQEPQIKSLTAGGLKMTSDDYKLEGNTATAAGTHEMTITGEGNFTGTATKEFTIAQATVTTTDKPTQNTVYEGTEVSKVTFKENKVTVSLNNRTRELEGTWSVVAKDGAMKFDKAGKYTCEAIFTPSDKNFAPITMDVEITVTNRPSGGGALPTTEVVTIDKVTTSPAEVKNETKTDADGTKETISKVTVSDANQKEIIKQVKDNKSGEIVINVSEKEVADNAKLEISLDKDFIDSIVKDTDAKLTIKTPEGDKTFTQEELKKLSESAAADGTITVDPTASEPTDTTKAEKITKAKGLIEKLNLMARSSKTAKKNAKVILKRNETTNSCIKELKDLGFTVKYRFYRSTKKSAGYKSTVTKKTASYMNTNGKKGTKYFYKIQIRVYDENGKLIAKTALKQCKYASRIWSK